MWQHQGEVCRLRQHLVLCLKLISLAFFLSYFATNKKVKVQIIADFGCHIFEHRVIESQHLYISTYIINF